VCLAERHGQKKTISHDLIGRRQSDAAPNHEKSSGNQDRQAEQSPITSDNICGRNCLLPSPKSGGQTDRQKSLLVPDRMALVGAHKCPERAARWRTLRSLLWKRHGLTIGRSGVLKRVIAHRIAIRILGTSDSAMLLVTLPARHRGRGRWFICKSERSEAR
jgi:hypothetical protein